MLKCVHMNNGICLLKSKIKDHYVFVDNNYCLFKCKHNKSKMPPATQQLKNTITATGQAVKSGFKPVSKEEQDRRFKICKGCEFLTDNKLKRCSKCGCCVTLKKKLEAWHCPLKKW